MVNKLFKDLDVSNMLNVAKEDPKLKRCENNKCPHRIQARDVIYGTNEVIFFDKYICVLISSTGFSEECKKEDMLYCLGLVKG